MILLCNYNSVFGILLYFVYIVIIVGDPGIAAVLRGCNRLVPIQKNVTQTCARNLFEKSESRNKMHRTGIILETYTHTSCLAPVRIDRDNKITPNDKLIQKH